MILKAKTRQTGAYGTVNEGDTVEVLDSTGEELLALGNFEKASKPNPTVTPEEVSEHNLSGLDQEPIHADGTNREILNTDGRKLHESGPDLIDEATARVEAEVEPDLDGAPSDKAEKEEKATTGRQTKEDKAAKSTK